MNFLYKLFSALAIMAVFGYLAYTMYFFDQLEGRQYRIVILIAGFTVGIFGKVAAAAITAIVGLAAGGFALWSKDDEEEKDKIITTKHL